MSTEPELTDEGQRELDLRVGLGSYASEDQLDRLLSIARYVDVDAGCVLYTRNAPVTTLFQLLRGKLEIQAPESPTWGIVRGTAGFIDFMLSRPHARTAVAVTSARVLELDAAAYREYLEDNFDISHRIMSRLSSEIMADLATRPEAIASLTTPPQGPSPSFASVEIPLVERLLILSRMAALRGASMQALANLAQCAAEVRFEPGAIVAAAGTRSSAVMLLVEGSVELVLPSGLRAIRETRAFVAHIEELAIAPRLTSAIAISPVIVLQIERDELLDLLEEHFDLAMALFAFIMREQETLNDTSATAGIELVSEWG